MYVFIFGGREFQTDDPGNENSSCIGQCECKVRQLFDLYSAAVKEVKELTAQNFNTQGEILIGILRCQAHKHLKHKHSSCIAPAMEEFLMLLILLTLIGNGRVKLALLLAYRESLVFYMNLSGTTPHDKCIIYVR